MLKELQAKAGPNAVPSATCISMFTCWLTSDCPAEVQQSLAAIHESYLNHSLVSALDVSVGFDKPRYLGPADTSFKEVSVVRNAGGRAFEALRTVLLIHNLVRGGFKTIMIVHHTGTW